MNEAPFNESVPVDVDIERFELPRAIYSPRRSVSGPTWK